MNHWFIRNTFADALCRIGGVIGRSLKPASAGLFMDARRVHEKARPASILAAFFLAAAAGAAFGATPPNTPIANVATARFTVAGTTVTGIGSVTAVTSPNTPATIKFYSFVATTDGLPPGMATKENLPVTQCDAGAGYKPLPNPNIPGRGRLTVPGSVLLAPASLYAAGDVVFVQVTDYDQNTNPLVAETIEVTVSASDKDVEKLKLTETGPSTGVFIGYISTSAAAAQSGNCVLNIVGNEKITATYVDQSENNVAISAAALVDPKGIAFDSATGQPIDGAQITMIDMATGQPARVFGNDGSSIFPSTLITGGSVTDSGGEVYRFEPGRFQFPRVAPGTYRLQVVPPSGYTTPSAVATTVLQALPGAPFSIALGSRGETFPIVPGPALIIDIPMDPGPLGDVAISKTAGKAVVAVGDFVPYTLSISNRGKNPIASLRIADRLPQGFRYQAGSAYIGDAGPTRTVAAEPAVSPDGRTVEFNLAALPGSGQITLHYVAAVGAGAVIGPAENVAQATGRVTSNVARATVQVREELNRSRAILMGRVTQVNACEDDETDGRAPKPVPLTGVRVMLEDGTYIVTDDQGRWHADNIRPGTHVVQLDEISLPKGYQLKSCEQNTRFAGRNFSQFVNVRGGTLWRSDFRLVRVQSCVNEQLTRNGRTVTLKLAAPVAHQSLSATVMLPNGLKLADGSGKVNGQPSAEVSPGDGFVVFRLGPQTGKWQSTLSFDLDADAEGALAAMVRLQSPDQPPQSLKTLSLPTGQAEASQCAPIAAPTAQADAAKAAAVAPAKPSALSLVEKLPYDDKWVAAAEPGIEWLHPKVGFVPALPVVKVAVKHEPTQRVELTVNGVPVKPIRYEGMVQNPAATIGVSLWAAVEIGNGRNVMEVTVRDAAGNVVFQESRVIHYGLNPSVVEYDAKRSRLLADGKTPPLIAVRMLDQDGQPVRRGVRGDFQVVAPYASLDQAEAIQREPLSGNLGGGSRFEVGEDGVALIALQPTTQAGEAVVRFDFSNGVNNEVRAWLTPDLREWVMVGFGEGTIGHKRLSGNMESLKAAGADDQLFDQNRLAFYAKGQVKGEYLLTVAYDTAKEQGAAGSRVLKQAIDPNRYYTLYADSTAAQFDAASASRLYLRIEKAQFYAMFGDYDTGLTVTELGRYSRTLNGVKSEYKGDTFKYNAFAARTSQSFRKDEIQGDGTSGVYRLQARNIVIGSDKVRIEVRDRFHPDQVISTRGLTAFLDYQIDYTLGTLFFREPIATRDENFNPVFIVAEYEADDKADARMTYGGRVAAKLGPKSEAGVTHIHEGTVGREASLTAADMTLQLGEATKLRAEAAVTHTQTDSGTQSGNAYLVELSHTASTATGRAYLRQQEGSFGLGQQAAAASSNRKIGADGSLKLSETLQVQGEAYREQNLLNDAHNDVAGARVQWKDKDGPAVSVGARMANTLDDKGQESHARQVNATGSYEMMDKRLTLRAAADLDAGSSGGVSFPNRLTLGADYKLSPETTVFAQHEIARGADLKADTTKVGLRTRPWTGGEMRAAVGNQTGLDGGRMYADMGLVQKWELDEHWRADLGLDRVQQLRVVTANPLGLAVPLASGTPATAATGIVTGDYTSLAGGLAYTDKVWSANGRAEWRHAVDEDKVNLLLGAQRNLDNGRSMAAGMNYTMVDAGASGVSGPSKTSKMDMRLSYAYRPMDSKLVWLDRLEYVHESTETLQSKLFTRKLINNFNANWTPNRRTQVALQYGAKYVRETIDPGSYTGFTDLMAVEARYDITERWDVGLHAGVLHSWRTHQRDYQLGVSVGFKVTENTWLTVGYNQLGFSDADFAGSDYRAKGLYLNLRMKFDQDTFDLNERKPAQLPLKQ